MRGRGICPADGKVHLMPDNPLSRSEFLVIGFDPRDASLTVLDNLG